jgi:pimeloyl-ACP methyl ester carboxylesterase
VIWDDIFSARRNNGEPWLLEFAMPTARPTAPAERIVHALSEDGFHLAGLLFTPATPGDTLVLWVHGLHQGFAAPEYCAIARAVAAGGTSVLSVETRGHDFGVWLRGPGGTRLAGTGWELFSECLADLGGWITQAQALGYTRLVLAGHGYGGAKVVFHMAERAERVVCGIVIASSGSLVRDPLDAERVAEAEAMVADGRALDLMPWGTRPGSLHSTVSAQVYLSRARVHRDLYGFGELPPALARVGCPVLAWFGEREANERRDPQAFLDTMRRNAARAPWVETRVLKGASYLYTGAEAVVARELLRFVARVAGDDAGAAVRGVAA